MEAQEESRKWCPRASAGGISFLLLFLVVRPLSADVTVYPMDLDGFNAAAGNPPVAIDFDSIAPGTDITGQTIRGVTFLGPGAPLIVVRGTDTYTPGGFTGAPHPETNKLFPTTDQNVLSPGGIVLGPGPDPAVEDDDLSLVFSSPVAAFGLDHLWQSQDGASNTSVSVFDSEDVQLFSGLVPIADKGGSGAPGGADFWGIVSDQRNIARIVIDEYDANNVNPDSNIGFDTMRFVPEPSTLWLLALGALSIAACALGRGKRAG